MYQSKLIALSQLKTSSQISFFLKFKTLLFLFLICFVAISNLLNFTYSQTNRVKSESKKDLHFKKSEKQVKNNFKNESSLLFEIESESEEEDNEDKDGILIATAPISFIFADNFETDFKQNFKAFETQKRIPFYLLYHNFKVFS